MWVRKSPTELVLEKQGALLRATCVNVLLGTALWYVLVRLSAFLGLPFQGPVSGYVGCGVVIVLLPTALFAEWRAQRKTSLADQSSPVKTARASA
jgi:hypothetical protein